MTTRDTELDQAVAALRAVIFDQTAPLELPAALAGHQGLYELFTSLSSIRSCLLALSSGNLETTISFRGRCAGAMKALQSNLRHLTWQTQQIATGDLTQKVVFMGEFSSAFNSMVSQLADARERLNQLAIRDPLTGLYNRRFLLETLMRELSIAGRVKSSVAVIMIDIDRFKTINDSWGHAAGDSVLVSLAALLKGSMRLSDLAARYGGEEFMVVLPGMGLDTAMVRAEKMRTDFESMVIKSGDLSTSCTFSIGLAMYPENGTTPQELIDAADKALYSSKQNGRNRVTASAKNTP